MAIKGDDVDVEDEQIVWIKRQRRKERLLYNREDEPGGGGTVVANGS